LGGAGGERRLTFFVPLAVDVLLIALSAGLGGGERPSKECMDTGESCCDCAGGTASAPPGDRAVAGS